jgi:hypothetical protein
MDFSDLPQWLQDLIPWFTVGTLIGVFVLTVAAILKFFGWHKDKNGED